MDDDAQRDELHEITVAARAQRRAQGTAPRP
jgi:hypothetical protein